MTRSIVLFISIVGLIILSSCKSYLIPVESFKEQFMNVDSTKLKHVVVRGPYGEKYNYLANPIELIRVVDKHGNNTELVNSPSIEIRFTYLENNRTKRTIYYFDRVCLHDQFVTGVRSRFIPTLVRTIPIESIQKIEIQDGKKKFSYVEK